MLAKVPNALICNAPLLVPMCRKILDSLGSWFKLFIALPIEIGIFAT
jgi:hypothetical protein